MSFDVVKNGIPAGVSAESQADCCDDSVDGNWQEGGWLTNNGICHFDGPEANLPLGGYTNVPGWGPEKAAKRWEVDAPETDEGKIFKKTEDLILSDFITGVELNEKTLKGHVYKIRDANGGPLRNPVRNKSKDELALVAIRNMRQVLRGERTIINL